ncbi:MAG: hypothetical protein HY700_01835 [Gemmatimonadetes bacterium]|nr:hypothetical protein [Gemmatimonadota bacterium]
MTGGLPTGPGGPLLDRAAVERIIQRAAELQASERDIGEGLSERDLLQLGQDVGIPDAFLRQAILEERTRSVTVEQRGLAAWLAGPRLVSAARAVPGEAQRIEAALHQWMHEGELLQVKRRYPQQTSWEPKQGAMASLRRAMGFGGRSYVLTQAREVVGQVTPLDASRCHVRLVADLRNTFSDRLTFGFATAGAGAVTTAVGVTLGVALPVAVLPVVLAVLAGGAIARGRHRDIERVHVALEQILDRLEHGEIDVETQLRGPRPSAFIRIADELLKKGLGPGK